MKLKLFNRCPVCGEKLQASKLTCMGCHAEFPTDNLLSPYDYLSEELSDFLQTFLSCRGNMREVQAALNISYPTAKKRLDELLVALGYVEKEEDTVDMSFLKNNKPSSTKASDIIRNKLYENGGRATVLSVSGNSYIIKAANDGKSFLCDELPIKPPYEYTVFDVIVDLLIRQGGKARKGNGRNYRLGEGDCTEDTVVGAIAKNYAGKEPGSSVYDPVFVLTSVMEWAGIIHNDRGYIELSPEYCQKLNG